MKLATCQFHSGIKLYPCMPILAILALCGRKNCFFVSHVNAQWRL